MGQDYLDLEILLQCLLTFWMINSKGTNMCGKLRQRTTLHATHRKHRANDRILIASGDVGTRQVQIGEDQPRIWSVRSKRNLFLLQKRLHNPRWLHDRDHLISRLFVLLEVAGLRYDMRDSFEIQLLVEVQDCSAVVLDRTPTLCFCQ